MSTHRRIAVVLAAIWIAIVIVLGLTERRGIVGLPDSLAEPAQHVVSFAVLAALLVVAFPGREWWIAAVLLVGGIAGEVLQLATDDRTFDVADIAFDAVGIAVGIGVVLLAQHRLDLGVLVVAAVLLAAAPFVLVVEALPETSFPDRCSAAPPAVGGEPVVLFEHQATAPGSDPTAPGSDQIDADLDEIVAALDVTDELSVETWVETADLDQTGPARVFTISHGIGQDEVNFHIGVDGDGLSVRFRNACEWFNWIEIDDVIEVGRPQHVIVTWSAGVIETWIDGTSVDRTTLDWGDLASWDTEFSIVVGDEDGGGRRFRGTVDSVSIWDRALDDATIIERSERRPT